MNTLPLDVVVVEAPGCEPSLEAVQLLLHIRVAGDAAAELFVDLDDAPANQPPTAETAASLLYLEGCQTHNEEKRRLSAGLCGSGVPAVGQTQEAGAHQTRPTTTTTETAFLHYVSDTPRDNRVSEAVHELEAANDAAETWMSVPAPALELRLSDPRLIDHAIYVVGLLSARSRLDENGWRPLTWKDLAKRLGEQRVAGRQVERATLLLGTRSRPEEGELIKLGVVERDSSYWAGGAEREAFSQRYRLRDQAWLDAERVGVHLSLRPSGRAKAAVKVDTRPDEAPVPDYLRRVYPHDLDVEAAVRHIIDDARAHAPKRRRKKLEDLDLNDFDALDAAIVSLGEIKNPELAGKKGRPPKGVCRDLRERWRHALAHVFGNYVASTPLEHKLSRAHGRLFSPFVGLWSELRGCVRLRGEPLVELDIKNAQPLLIAARMVDEGFGDVPDVRDYVDLVQRGLIYEFAVNLLRGCALDTPVSVKDRTKMKIGFYSGWMFCQLDTMDRADFGKAMRLAFPTVDQWVKDQKLDDYRAFPCACQRYESTLLVDKLAEIFEREQLDVLTVHDAAYVRASQADRAAELLSSEVLAALPVTPIVVAKPVGVSRRASQVT